MTPETPFQFKEQPQPSSAEGPTDQWNNEEWRNIFIKLHDGEDGGGISCYYNPFRDVLGVDWEDLRVFYGDEVSERQPGRVGQSGHYEQKFVEIDQHSLEPEYQQLWNLAQPHRKYYLQLEFQNAGPHFEDQPAPQAHPSEPEKRKPILEDPGENEKPVEFREADETSDGTEQLERETQRRDEEMFRDQTRDKPIDTPTPEERFRQEQEEEMALQPGQIILSVDEVNTFNTRLQMLQTALDTANELIEDAFADRQNELAYKVYKRLRDATIIPGGETSDE